MSLPLVFGILAAFVIAAIFTGVIRWYALTRGLLDVPNERSSHTKVTPRGGGAAVVLSTTVILLGGGALDLLPWNLVGALTGGGIAIALIGFLDDIRPRSPAVRLVIHVAAALWALYCLGGLAPMQVGEHTVTWGAAGYVFGVLGIVWTLNLFNFMDGIDGIAASEAAFIAIAGAFLAIVSTGGGVSVAALVFAAACVGFLVWNWPPAKIFMGDVGSGYMGYVIAVLAIAAGRDNPVGLLVWLILGALFFIDATITLVRRAARGESVHQAHRSHAYQILSRRWGSHRRMTVAALGINVCWLLPCAWLAVRYPRFAGWIVVGALLPVIVGVVASGAGRREPSAS
jgi:Fuc2NAc and GlcNAc transferase